MNAKLQEILGQLTESELGMLRLHLEEKAMYSMVEAVVSAAAILQDRDKWLVMKSRHYRIANIKQVDKEMNGRVYVQNSEDDTAYIHEAEEWANRRIMTTMEVMGLCQD